MAVTEEGGHIAQVLTLSSHLGTTAVLDKREVLLKNMAETILLLLRFLLLIIIILIIIIFIKMFK